MVKKTSNSNDDPIEIQAKMPSILGSTEALEREIKTKNDVDEMQAAINEAVQLLDEAYKYGRFDLAMEARQKLEPYDNREENK